VGNTDVWYVVGAKQLHPDDQGKVLCWGCETT
jgi:hypothetical protein